MGEGEALPGRVAQRPAVVEGREVGEPPTTVPSPNRGRGIPPEPSGETARFERDHLAFASIGSVRSGNLNSKPRAKFAKQDCISDALS